MKFDFICGVILWVLPILLGLLAVKVVGVKKGKLETKYRFGSIGALVILLGSFLMILMFVIMGDMRDWDRFHQMTIMSHGGMEILKWVIGICKAGLKVEILVKLHSTPCISQDETVICI